MELCGLAGQYLHNAQHSSLGGSDADPLKSYFAWKILGPYSAITQPIYLLPSPWYPDFGITISATHALCIKSSPANAAPAGRGAGAGHPLLGQGGT